MRKTRFREEQITYSLKQVESGRPVGEVCRQGGMPYSPGDHLPPKTDFSRSVTLAAGGAAFSAARFMLSTNSSTSL